MANEKSFVELEALLKYAAELNDLSKTLKDSLKATDYGLKELKGSFGDEQAKRFEQKFEADAIKLKPVFEALDNYAKKINGEVKDVIKKYNDLNWNK